MHNNKIMISILGLSILYRIISSEELQKAHTRIKPTPMDKSSLQSAHSVNSPYVYDAAKICPPAPRKPMPVEREHILVNKAVRRKLFFNLN